MKKLIWILPALALMGIGLWSGIVIVRWNSMDKTLPEIPDYTTYNEAVGTELPKQLVREAEAAECAGYILPISVINGLAPEGLLEDLNLSLAAYPNWQLLVSSDEKETMKKRWDNKVKDWGNMMSGRDFQKFLTTQKSVAFKTNYSIRVDFFDKLENQLDTRKIILSINDEKTHSRLFEIPVTYTDSETIAAGEAEREERQIDLINRENKVEITRVVLWGSAVIVGSIYLLLSIISVLKINKNKSRRKSYLLQIEKRENLINDGHYTAALELAENYLSYFPDDMEIKAFKQRIVVFCGGDTGKAEEAFVHAAKLNSILETSGEKTGRSLSQEEKSQISSFLPYNQNLKESYSQFLAIEDKRNTENRRQEEVLLETISRYIESREIDSARETLNELEHLNPTRAELKELQIILAPGPANLILRRKDGKQVIYLITKSDIIIGRFDDNKLDVPLSHNRVSRQHLRLSLLEDKLIAEDLGSTNGSYINGESITSIALAVGDTLNIAKIMDFEVTGSRGNNRALALHNRELSLCFVSSPLSFSAGQGNAEIDRIGDLFWINAGKLNILKAGRTVTVGTYEYSVEEL